MRPKDIGTRYETSTVRYLRAHGFGNAERRALAGIHDLGDITGTPGIVWECKSGKAAYTASDGQVESWLDETERERAAANANAGVLVMDRSGYGPVRVGETWAVIRADALGGLLDAGQPFPSELSSAGDRPVRMHLAAVVMILRDLGFGDIE